VNHVNRKTIGIIALFILSSGLWLNQGQAANVQITSELGYGGYIVPGRWAPLKVQVNGAVDSPRIEIIRQTEDNEYSPVESFSYQGGDQVECPFFANEDTNAKKVRLFSGSQILLKQSIQTRTKIFPGHMILTINIPAPIQQTIERALRPSEPVLVIQIDFNELPGLILDYDAISGIVMNDPGLILLPSQIRALRSWLAGGGHLVIHSARPSSESIISTLVAPSQIKDNKDTQIIETGFGNITLIHRDVNENAGSHDPAFWQRLLALEPYREGLRITAGSCFLPHKDLDKTNFIPKVTSNVTLMLTIWALLTLAIVFLVKRNKFFYLFCFIIVSIIAVFPLENLLQNSWQRGAEVYTKAVILPDSGGTLINTYIQLKKSYPGDFSKKSTSPWGINITAGHNESGTIYPSSSVIWQHRMTSPLFTIRSGANSFIDLVGWFPEVPFQQSKIFNKSSLNKEALVLKAPIFSWDGKNWCYLNRSHWKKASILPYWLQDERSWITWLQESTPAKTWLIGYGVIPNLKLKIQGTTKNELIWVMPLLKGVAL
jgi:hypothetical protein